jgi:hypothetical protein
VTQAALHESPQPPGNSASTTGIELDVEPAKVGSAAVQSLEQRDAKGELIASLVGGTARSLLESHVGDYGCDLDIEEAIASRDW